MLTNLVLVIGLYCSTRILEMVLDRIKKPGQTYRDCWLAISGMIALALIFYLTITAAISGIQVSDALRGFGGY